MFRDDFLIRNNDLINRLIWAHLGKGIMAGQQVHNMKGRNCGICQHQFTPASMNLTLSIRKHGFIEKIRVCGKCYNEQMSTGE